MAKITDYLLCTRQITKLHDHYLRQVSGQYGLTLMEANIISFLYNNPGCDTARDIVELRGFSKGNVSNAVESLIRKSLLKRDPDARDRRRIHLSLLPAARSVTAEIEKVQTQFREKIFSGFSEEEVKTMNAFTERIRLNTLSEQKEGK